VATFQLPSTATVAAVFEKLAEDARDGEKELVHGTEVLHDDTRRLHQLRAGDGSLRLMLVRVPSKHVLTGSSDGSLHFWNCSAKAGLLWHRKRACNGSVRAVSVCWSQRRALCGGDDCSLSAWDLSSQVLLWKSGSLAGPLQDLSVDWSAGCAMCCCKEGLHCLSIEDEGKQLASTRVSGLRSIAVDWPSKQTLVGCDSGDLKLFDEQCDFLREFRTTGPRYSNPTWCVAIDIACQRALSGSHDGALRVWHPGTGSLLETLRGHAGAVRCVVVSSSLHRAASGGDDGAVCLWDLDHYETFRVVQAHAGPVRCLAIDWFSEVAVSGSDDCTLCSWSLGSGDAVQMKKLHTHKFLCMAASFQ